MDGRDWLMVAVPTLAAAVPTGREVLAFLRARRWARVVEQVAESAKPGARVCVDAEGALDLSFDRALADHTGDDGSPARSAP
ncbi:MAG TPA: hypothetical protein VJT31_14205 [Rugosimonospora sp.]|nr:hypothetical protein [Rugosimonospora sp.]